MSGTSPAPRLLHSCSVVLLLCAALSASGADRTPPPARKRDTHRAHRPQPDKSGVAPLVSQQARFVRVFRELRKEFPELDSGACVRFYLAHGWMSLSELDPLLKDAPQKARQTARDLARNFLHIEQVRETNPDEHARLVRIERLKNDSRILARQITQDGAAPLPPAERKAAKPQLERLQKQLVELLASIFAAKSQNQLIEINRLEAELNEMKRLLKQREASRGLIIRDSYFDLIGQPCPERFLAQ